MKLGKRGLYGTNKGLLGFYRDSMTALVGVSVPERFKKGFTGLKLVRNEVLGPETQLWRFC